MEDDDGADRHPETFVAKDRGGRWFSFVLKLFGSWTGLESHGIRVGIEKKRTERSSQRDIMTSEGLNQAMQHLLHPRYEAGSDGHHAHSALGLTKKF